MMMHPCRVLEIYDLPLPAKELERFHARRLAIKDKDRGVLSDSKTR